MSSGGGIAASRARRVARGLGVGVVLGLTVWWLLRAPASRSFAGAPPMDTGASSPEVHQALVLLRDAAAPALRLKAIRQLREIARRRRNGAAGLTPAESQAFRVEADTITLVMAAHARSDSRKLYVRSAAVYAIGDWVPMGARNPVEWLRQQSEDEQLPHVLRDAFATARQRVDPVK
jgi:hypothetical protein